MSISVTLSTVPPQVYSIADRLTALDPVRRPLSGLTGSAENANMGLKLDNGDGVLSTLFRDPPLMIPAIISVDSVIVFRGVVTQVTLGAECSLEVPA